jgi:hypothetical protein
MQAKEDDQLLKRYVKEFGTDRCVEVDALPSDEIRARLETSILKRLDKTQWDATLDQERDEQSKLIRLNKYIRRWGLAKAVEILGKDISELTNNEEVDEANQDE